MSDDHFAINTHVYGRTCYIVYNKIIFIMLCGVTSSDNRYINRHTSYDSGQKSFVCRCWNRPESYEDFRLTLHKTRSVMTLSLKTSCSLLKFYSNSKAKYCNRDHFFWNLWNSSKTSLLNFISNNSTVKILYVSSIIDVSRISGPARFIKTFFFHAQLSWAWIFSS